MRQSTPRSVHTTLNNVLVCVCFRVVVCFAKQNGASMCGSFMLVARPLKQCNLHVSFHECEPVSFHVGTVLFHIFCFRLYSVQSRRTGCNERWTARGSASNFVARQFWFASACFLQVIDRRCPRKVGNCGSGAACFAHHGWRTHLGCNSTNCKMECAPMFSACVFHCGCFSNCAPHSGANQCM